MPPRATCLLALAALAAACAWPRGAQAGAVYKCIGANGTIAYTNRPSGPGCTTVSRYGAGDVRRPAAGSAQATRAWDYRDARGTAAPSETADAPASAPSSAPSSAEVRVANATPSAEAAAKVVRGAVYRVERKNGIVEYTNVKPAGGAAFAVLFTYIATCVACDVHSNIDFAHTRLNLDAFRDEIARAATDFGVDGALLRAVVHAESAFNPLAVSAKGAQGLMQLMPGTASDLGVADAFDAAQNIRGGAQYLASLLRSFGGDERLATAAYNAGPGAVQKYNGVPPYDETRVYVERVQTLRDRYRQAAP